MMDWPLMRINHVLPSHQFQSRWHPPFWRSRVCAINNDNVMAKSCLLWQFKSVLIAPRIFFSKWNIFHLFFTGGSFTGQCVWFFLYIFLYTFPSFKEYFLKKENRNVLRFEVPVSSWADGRLAAPWCVYSCARVTRWFIEFVLLGCESYLWVQYSKTKYF